MRLSKDDRFVSAMAELAESMESTVDLDKTLKLITHSAVETIPGVDWASVTLTHSNGSVETLAATHDLVGEADQLQYSLGEGPCIEAAKEQHVVLAQDVAGDSRWPRYGPKAADLGVHSQLAFQFHSAHHARGALNLYGGKPDAFHSEAILLARLFATNLATAMGWSRHEESLNEALATRKVIGQAIGIVMERYQVDEDKAFRMLLRRSQSENIKLRVVTEELVTQSNEQARIRQP